VCSRINRVIRRIMPQALKSILPLVAHLASSHCGIYVRVRSRPTAGVRTSGGLKLRLPALDTLLEIRRTLTGGTEARGDVIVDQGWPECSWCQSHFVDNANHTRAGASSLTPTIKYHVPANVPRRHYGHCRNTHKGIFATILDPNPHRV